MNIQPLQTLGIQQQIAKNGNHVSKAMKNLSTGLKINSAADGPSNIGLKNSTETKIRGNRQGIQNAQDVTKMLEFIDDKLKIITENIQRMRELAVKAANDATLSNRDKSAIQKEIKDLTKEIRRIAKSMKYNGKEVGGDEKIVYLSFRDLDWEIFTVNPDGSNPTQVTDNFDNDATPLISPDGANIIFERNGGIYLTDIQGNNEKFLATGLNPLWAHDGTQIIYHEVGVSPPEDDIFIMNSDGSNKQNLTQDPFGSFIGDWSYDGNNILYTQTFTIPGSLENEISTISPNDTNQNQLTNMLPFWHSDSANFSPDESKIVFSASDWWQRDIFVMNSDGSELVNLTNNPANDWFPVFSPDGSQIAFQTNRDGNEEIYVINVDGSNLRNITNNASSDYDPVWSPDGTQIAFTTERDGNAEIYVMDADGSNPINISNHPQDDAFEDFGMFYWHAQTAQDFIWSNAAVIENFNFGTNQNIDFTFRPMKPQNLGLNGLSIMNPDQALSAIDRCDNALKIVSDYQAEIGQLMGELNRTINTMQAEDIALNQFNANNIDANMAAEMTSFTKGQISQDISVSMMAQANLNHQQAMSLLIGTVS